MRSATKVRNGKQRNFAALLNNMNDQRYLLYYTNPVPRTFFLFLTIAVQDCENKKALWTRLSLHVFLLNKIQGPNIVISKFLRKLIATTSHQDSKIFYIESLGSGVNLTLSQRFLLRYKI